MNLPAKTISIGWIGIATIVPSAYITYYLYDSYNPTGNAWLKESGYSFRRPVFAEHEKPIQSCSNNLFGIDKDDAVSDTKLYGCAVMGIDIYNTGHEFTTPNIDPKYINFSSEIALRKGDKGWVINTRINNYSTNNQIDFNYLLSRYEYSNDQWNKEATFSIWPDLNVMRISEMQLTTKAGSGGDSVQIKTQGKQLHIKIPKGDWLNNYLVKSDSSKQATERKKFIHSKQYIGFWIPVEQETKWVFEDINIQFRDQDKSMLMCKSGGNDKCSFDSFANYKLKELKKTSYDSWQKIINNQDSSIQDDPKLVIRSMIATIKNEKGKWVGIGDICGLQWVRNLNEEQKKHLKMFCAADKPKSTTQKP